MVLTITLNPMLDKTVHIGQLQRGAIHRATAMETVPGGKGINVSRQLKRLGIRTLATGFLGGDAGHRISEMLTAEGVDHEFVMTNARTRDGVTYLEPDGTWTAVFEPAFAIDAMSVDALRSKFDKLIPQCSWVMCGGSSPGEETDDLFFEAIVKAHDAGLPSVLDSYGNAFGRAMKAKPTMVKPNKKEFESTYNARLESAGDYVDAINFLFSQGANYCIITDGGSPFYAGVKGHYWKVSPPAVRTVNPTGSGDAMIAGILYGFRQGWKFERCLAFGAAAGAANAMMWEVALLTLDDIMRLEAQVVIQRV
ncbi:MAG TPA: hexose kinase [Bacteroidota bacterium]|nr:hexose kinase [Bacteroidota bacterium]